MNEQEEPSTRARWLGVMLILAALAVLIWQAWLSGVGDELPPVAAPLVSQGRNPVLGDMLGSVDSTRLGAQAASAAAVAFAASAALAADETELCGQGRVKADAAGQPKDPQPVRLAAQRGRERLLPVLLGSPNEVTRAAGLLLQAVGSPGAGDSAVPPNAQARDTLAQMANGGRSPQVYAWALHACQGQRGDGMCQLLSAEQWARLEPGNAIAWLQVGVDAQARRDPAAVAEAVYRVTHASNVDMRFGALAGVALRQLPTDLPLLSKGAVIDEVMAVENGLALPHLIATQHCSQADVRDANRHQVCAAVADLFHAKGTTLVDLGVAASIGERVGWPAERVSAVRDERDAFQQLQSRRLAGAAWSCASIDQTLRQLTDIGQLGEIAVVRRTLKESTDAVAVLAQRYRDAAAARRVASAGVGVSAASAMASAPLVASTP